MYVFIVNPIAGGGRGNRVYSNITKSRIYKDIESISYFTKHKGHAEEITKKLLERNSEEITALVAIGGDGTLHEIINGLSNIDIPVAFIPGGSGNDFARGCALDKNPIKILENIVDGDYYLPYYIGSFGIDEERSRLFTNNMGFGFDAMITKAANDSKYKKLLNKVRLGKISYVIALIHVLFKFKPMDIEVIINEEKKKILDCWMVTITNHPYYGGGMKIIPDSKIQPDVFPVLLIHSISKWKILFLFMTVFTGKHINFKEVSVLETSELVINAPQQIDYQVDGESGRCSTALISKNQQSIRVMGTKKGVN